MNGILGLKIRGTEINMNILLTSGVVPEKEFEDIKNQAIAKWDGNDAIKSMKEAFDWWLDKGIRKCSFCKAFRIELGFSKDCTSCPLHDSHNSTGCCIEFDALEQLFDGYEVGFYGEDDELTDEECLEIFKNVSENMLQRIKDITYADVERCYMAHIEKAEGK
jgi:hypothetical protein